MPSIVVAKLRTSCQKRLAGAVRFKDSFLAIMLIYYPLHCVANVGYDSNVQVNDEKDENL